MLFGKKMQSFERYNAETWSIVVNRGNAYLEPINVLKLPNYHYRNIDTVWM